MTAHYLGNDANMTIAEWYTPSYIFDALGCCFDLDPASPGKEILPLWVERFVDHANGLMLVPERTSTRWWQHLTSYADLVLFVNKRITFISPGKCKSSAQSIGSVLVAIGDSGATALENANR